MMFDEEEIEALVFGADVAKSWGDAEMGAAANIVEDARHPFMHRTDSVDYAVVLTGEIYMMMDDEDYLLKAGDTVVQQGTNHAWSNRGTEPCLIAFILVDAE